MTHPAWCDPKRCTVGAAPPECHIGRAWRSADGTVIVAIMQAPGHDPAVGVFDEASQIVLDLDQVEPVAQAIRREIRRASAR